MKSDRKKQEHLSTRRTIKDTVFVHQRLKELTVGDSGVQLAGHTSPCVSTNWNAFTKRSVSSTQRPTGRSLTLMCLTTPFGSMRNRPLEGH